MESHLNNIQTMMKSLRMMIANFQQIPSPNANRTPMRTALSQDHNDIDMV